MHCRAVRQFAPYYDRGIGRRCREADVDAGFQEYVVAPVFMHQRAARPARGQHLRDRRQLLQIQLHQRRQILRLGPAGGDADRHRLSDMADLVGGQHRLRRGLEARQPGDRGDRLDVDQVSGGKDILCAACRLDDAADAGVGNGAANESQIAHPGQRDVGDERALAAQVALILLAQYPLPDTA